MKVICTLTIVHVHKYSTKQHVDAKLNVTAPKHSTDRPRIPRMFCEHQTFANFDQFATIKSAKPKLLLVNTHDPCQNAIVRLQRVKFSAHSAHSQRFFTRKIF